MPSIYPRFPYGHNAGWEQPCRMVIYGVTSNETLSEKRKRRTLHTLRIGVCRYLRRNGDDWRVVKESVFKGPGELWQFVTDCTNRREPLWVYAHDQSFAFTLVDGWTQIESRRLLLEHQGADYVDRRTGKTRTPAKRYGRIVADGIPWIVDGWMDGRRVRFVDFLNYCRSPLKEVASSCGMQRWLQPSQSSTDNDWQSYCRQDVEILQSAVLKLMNLWRGRRLGTWQATMAGLAFSSFRHLSPSNGIVSHGDDDWPKGYSVPYDKWGTGHELSAKEVASVERRSYVGGRVFLGFVGSVAPDHCVWPAYRDQRHSTSATVECGPLTVVDVNGLYAYVMRHMRFPTELMCTVRRPSVKLAEQLTKDFECIADVSIHSQDTEYPLRKGVRVLYPTGRFSTSLAGVELRNALVLGHVTAVENLCVYYVGRPFTPFVDYWWELRQQAKRDNDSVTAKLAKGIINALFGKLGQREPLWKLRPDVTPAVPWGGFIATDPATNTLKRFRSIARHVQEMTGKRDCPHTFTAAAACVTAHARNYMDQLRHECPQKSVVYQDTDSLFLLPPALEALASKHYLHQTDLGRLKTEGTYELCTIVAPKVYQLDGKQVAAGLKSSSIPLDCTTYEMVQFQRSGAIITHNPQGVIESWKTIWRTPHLTSPVVVNADGWTSPITIS